MTDTNDPNIVGDPHDLNRFVQAQVGVYDRALAEIKSGRKRSCWMWFIFPQLNRLGSSSTSWSYKHYAIKTIEEAKAYLAPPPAALTSFGGWAALRHKPQASASQHQDGRGEERGVCVEGRADAGGYNAGGD